MRPFVKTGRLFVLLGAFAQVACAARSLRVTYVRAEATPEPPPGPPPAVVPTMASPASTLFGGQMKRWPPRGTSDRDASRPSPQQVVSDANRKAVQAPDRSDYFNAIVQYAYESGTLYQVFAAPMRITDIALEPGEKILGQPASGDVVRWLLALGKSMDQGVEQWHVYLKPTRPELETNVAINTDRRTYLLELHSYADTYMAAVVWHYPQDDAARLLAQAADLETEQKSSAPVIGVDALNFDFTIEVIHGTPAWTPLKVFDDGRRTFVRFPAAMLVREAPALFVLRDKETQLVNYRVKGDTYVVDRLIDAAELRVGQQDQEIVRIVRGSPSQRSLARPIHARSGQ